MNRNGPTVLRHTMPEYMDVIYRCLSCGEDMEYHDGLSCTHCGLEWDSPHAEPRLNITWVEFAQNVAPDATRESPAHLMVFREVGYSDPAAWFIHIGCEEDTYDHTGECEFTEATGSNESAQFSAPSRFDFAENVPHGMTRYGRQTMPTGVYQVTVEGIQTMRVLAVLAYGGGAVGQNLGELWDPREVAPKLIQDGSLTHPDFDAEAWTAARSPALLAYWDTVAENRARMAKFYAEREARRMRPVRRVRRDAVVDAKRPVVDVELPRKEVD